MGILDTDSHQDVGIEKGKHMDTLYKIVCSRIYS